MSLRRPWLAMHRTGQGPADQPLDAKLVAVGTCVERDRYRIVRLVRRHHPGAPYTRAASSRPSRFCAAVRDHFIVGCQVSLPEADHRELIHHA